MTYLDVFSFSASFVINQANPLTPGQGEVGGPKRETIPFFGSLNKQFEFNSAIKKLIQCQISISQDCYKVKLQNMQ